VPLTIDDIRKLADLARLEITAGEVADVSAKLSAIVRLVDELRSVATTGITPMAHPLDQKQRLRADVVTEHDDHERYQHNAPAVERGLYLVPKVIE
jgi:aspartyl-tRNA(Asn)/glutamyl-tRNA(Gln) amidotransferase subunit C